MELFTYEYEVSPKVDTNELQFTVTLTPEGEKWLQENAARLAAERGITWQQFVTELVEEERSRVRQILDQTVSDINRMPDDISYKLR